jgi:hypothetical protein
MASTLSPTYESDEPREKDTDEEDYKEFTSEQDMSDTDQFALVTKLDKMFSYALNHTSWVRGREKMVQCFQYREGDQWTAAELASLAERHQPDTVNNQVAVVVNKLVGDVVNQRVRLGYRGRNAKLDESEANLLSDIFLFIKQSNDLEFEERDMADDGFTCGMGVLDVDVTFDDIANPFIKIRHEDPLIVFPDPDSRSYDWNEDAKFVARANWQKLEDVAEQYPQAELELNGVMGAAQAVGEDSGSGQLATVDQFKGEKYVDKNNERIRVIQVQYKKKEREQLCIFGDGTSVKFQDKKEIWARVKQAKANKEEYRIIDRLSHRICVGVYAGGILLEHKETDSKYFSLVPYFAYRRKTGEPYSLITLALSMQDAINKRESKALHLLTMNQVMAEKSSYDDKDTVQSEVAKADGFIELRDGALSQQRFVIQKNLDLAQSQFAMHQRATEDLYKIVGVDPKAGQQTGEIRSGAGLQRKYSEASKTVATLFDNIRRTRKILARVVLDRVQEYYTPNTTMLITDGTDGDGHEIGITADMLTKIKNTSYDVIVDELEDTDTANQQQISEIMQILPQVLPLGNMAMKMVLSLSTIRQKDELLKQIDSMSGPPPVAPKVNLQANLDALQPVERAGIWDLMGRKDIAQQVMQQSPMPSNEMKMTTEMSKAKINSQPDPYDATAKQHEAALELQQKTQEHAMKMQEMDTKHQIAQGKHEMDLQKLAAQSIAQRMAPQKSKSQGPVQE